jgi:hypothetical protein
MIAGRDREESIRLTAEALGIAEADAAIIVAWELGDPDAEDEVLLTSTSPRSAGRSPACSEPYDADRDGRGSPE